MNKISVIIPVYNGSKYLKRCLDSILNQTYKNIEIVAIDDGSSDESYLILNEYKDRNPTKMIVLTQENRGIAKTRNRGIAMSTGDYIMFCDNDDYYELDCFEKLYNEMVLSKSDVVISGYQRPNSLGNMITSVSLRDTRWTKFIVMAPWSKLYKRNLIIDNDIEFLDSNIGEDIYFNLQALLVAKKVRVMEYIGYNWFYNEESISNTLHKGDSQKLQELFLFQQCMQVLKQKAMITQENEDLVEYFFVKHMIWYIMYTARKKKVFVIKEQYQACFSMIEQYFPHYLRNKNLKLFYTNGEVFKTKVCISIFILCKKTKLLSVLFYVLSKL